MTPERIALILPLFAACYGIALAQHLTGRLGFVRLTVHGAKSVDEYPRVRTFLDDRVASASGLRPGGVARHVARLEAGPELRAAPLRPPGRGRGSAVGLSDRRATVPP